MFEFGNGLVLHLILMWTRAMQIDWATAAFALVFRIHFQTFYLSVSNASGMKVSVKFALDLGIK